MKSLLSILIITLIPIIGCKSPHTDSKTFTPEHESVLGNKIHAHYIQQEPIYKNEKLSTYIQRVGQSIVESNLTTSTPYQFVVLDTDQIQSFSLPGGYIYISRGLLAHLNSEDELAFILGHEIGHIAEKDKTSLILQNMDSKHFFPQNKESIDLKQEQELLQKALELSQMGHSQMQELKADQLSLSYLTQLHYNPESALSILNTMPNIKNTSPDLINRMLRYHPNPENRSKQLETTVKTISKDKSYPNISRKQYLENIDGLLLGKFKESGIQTADRYINYIWQFEFLFTKFWHISQSIEDNTLINLQHTRFPIRGSVIVQKDQEKPPLKDFSIPFLHPNAKVIRKQNNRTYHIYAYQTYSRIPHPNGFKIEIATYFKQNDLYYRFAFESEEKYFTLIKQLSELFLKQIKFIANSEVQSLTIKKIKIYQVKKGESLTEVAKQFNVEQKTLMILNQISETTPLEEGYLLKVPVQL